MKIISKILPLVMIISGMSCKASSNVSDVSMTRSDGRVQIQLCNHCDHDVTFGRMERGDLGTLKPEQRSERDLGSDAGTYTAIAYYGYKPGQFPGIGNMTLAEFTINPNGQKTDFYDVSLVDAYNIGMGINNGANYCKRAACGGFDMNECPAGQRIVKDGKIISCTKFNDRDNPNNPAAKFFEQRCENAYSWSGDNAATTGCDAQDYVVTFCPYR